MEVVLLSTFATQAALYALSLRTARPLPPSPTAASSAAGPSERAPAAVPSSAPALTLGIKPETALNPEAEGAPAGGDTSASKVTSTGSPREAADEEVDLTVSIEGLEAEIKALRAQATYSADTLVTASRADRKANELEAKLKALRGTPRHFASRYWTRLCVYTSRLWIHL